MDFSWKAMAVMCRSLFRFGSPAPVFVVIMLLLLRADVELSIALEPCVCDVCCPEAIKGL